MTALAHPTSGVETLVDPASLDADPRLSAAWRALAADARHPNPFQGPDLLVPALRHLAGDATVRLWTLPRPDGPNGSLDLLVPVSTGRRYRRLPWPVTVGWQHTHHFLGTPLVAAHLGPDVAPERWRTALDRLAARTSDSWLVLPQVDAAVARDLEVAAARDRRGVRRLADVSRPVTHRRPHDDYLERQLSGSRRKELRRCRRRLSEAVGGGLELVELVSAGRTEEGIEAFLRLEAAGWKGADGGAMAVDPAERAWFVESCRAAAASGQLEILSLEGRDGAPAAMGVDVLAGGVLSTLKIAYDERHAAWSPGLLLYLDQLHRFHGSGATLLDTCAAPGHPMASRLHPDRRELVTLAVGLHGRRGAAIVATAPRLLRAGDDGRTLARDVRRRLTRTQTTSTQTTSTSTPTPRGDHTMSLLQLDEASTAALRAAGETGEPHDVTHQLRSHELLTLEALADLAVSLPADSIEHNIGALPDVVADGKAPQLDLELRELILGIETNGAWCVLKNIEQDPRYSALLDACLDEIEDLVSGPGQAYNREGFVFLSAPNSMTPSHIDPEHNVLLQVQGRKTMKTGAWESPEARAVEAERLLTGGHRNLKGDVPDPVDHVLEPGDGVYVPPYTQHKVINGPALSISLSVTWRSPALAAEVKVLRANHLLRKVGIDPSAPGAKAGVDKAKASAMTAAARVKTTAKGVLKRGR